MQSARPIVAIGLDAFEAQLLQRWSASGDLPNLARLLREGVMLHLRSEWPGIALEPWHSFVFDRDLAEHGRFYGKVWLPHEGRIGHHPGWVGGERPFWRELADHGLRIAVVDVPFAPGPAHDPADLVVAGWQTHDEVIGGSRPSQLNDELREQLGPPALGPERYGDVAGRRLLAVRDRCLAATRQFRDIVRQVLARGPFDLVLAVLGTAHRAGHYLWDPQQLVADGRITRDTAQELEDGLLAVYRAADDAVGAIRAAAAGGASFVVFALHGMGDAAPWTERLPLLLDFLSAGRDAGAGAKTRVGLARARRSRLALTAARLLLRALQDHMSRLSSRHLYDWSRTRVFAVPSEGTAAIRVNLAGRDRFGIVHPGADYETTLEALEEELTGLRELATGEPLVDHIVRVDDVVDPAAAGRNLLPDLVVQWREVPASLCRGLAAPDGRTLDFGGPLFMSSGRTGDHRPEGFAIFAGPDVPAAVRAGVYRTRALPSLLRDLVLGSPGRMLLESPAAVRTIWATAGRSPGRMLLESPAADQS